MPSVIRANILMQKAFAGLDNHTPEGVQEAQRLFEEVTSLPLLLLLFILI